MFAAREPAFFAQVAVDAAEFAQQRHRDEEDVLRDRAGVRARNVGDKHAGPGRSLDRDHVEAGAVADRRPQPLCPVEERRGQDGANDDDVGVARLGGQRFGVDGRCYGQLAVAFEHGRGLAMQGMR